MSNILKLKIDEKRIYGLDILRAFAILFVIIQHGAHLLPDRLKQYNNLFVFDGVSIFFVLSGFLIGGILIKIVEKNTSKKINYKELFGFWIRRWFRTLPAYFLVLIILSLLFYFFSESFSLLGIGILTHKYFFFSQNLFETHPWFFGEAWSLSVEEWFYLITPLSIFFLIINLRIPSRKSVLLMAFLIMLSATLIRFIKFENIHIVDYDQWDLEFRKEVVTRLDSLMFGILGAYYKFYYPGKWKIKRNTFLVIGVFLLIAYKYVMPMMFNYKSLYGSVFSFSLMSVSILFMLPFFSNLKSGKGIFYKSITYISLISYSMYLINYSLVQNWIVNNINWELIFTNNNLLLFAKYVSYWVFTIGLSLLMYKYYELPFTTLRDKIRVIK